MILTFTDDPDKLVMAKYGQMPNTIYFRKQEQEAMEAHWAYIEKLREEVRHEQRVK